MQQEPKLRRATGIPQSFLTPLPGGRYQGAMITPSGHIAIPTMDQYVVPLTEFLSESIIN